MCDILFLAFLAIKIGTLAEDRGYSALLFRALFVGVWMLAEGMGWYIASLRISTEQMGFMRVWVIGFLAALVCGPLVFLLLFLLPNKGANLRTGAFGDYRDHLDRASSPDERKRAKRRRRRRAEDEDDPPAPSFDA